MEFLINFVGVDAEKTLKLRISLQIDNHPNCYIISSTIASNTRIHVTIEFLFLWDFANSLIDILIRTKKDENEFDF